MSFSSFWEPRGNRFHVMNLTVGDQYDLEKSSFIKTPTNQQYQQNMK